MKYVTRQSMAPVTNISPRRSRMTFDSLYLSWLRLPQQAAEKNDILQPQQFASEDEQIQKHGAPMNNIRNETSEFALFSEEEIRALDARRFEKNVRGEPATFITCLIRNKAVQLKPEERTRQLWLARLIDQYGYPASRIAVEYPITFGRDSSKRADIVVFDADRPTVPYIIIEVKQGKLRDGKEQLRSYAHATGAPLAMWSNGILAVVWHRKNPNYFVSIHHLPRANQTIDDIVDQPWTIQTLIDKENERRREGSKARSLRDLILEMENEVLANAGVDVFEEVFKLVFTKLYDEMSHHRGNYPVLRFRNSNTAAQLKKAIQKLFDDAACFWTTNASGFPPITCKSASAHSKNGSCSIPILM